MGLEVFVSLREKGVDLNVNKIFLYCSSKVSLREKGVDLNVINAAQANFHGVSPFVRREWI